MIEHEVSVHVFVKGDVEPMDVDPPEDERGIARELKSKKINAFSSNNAC